MVIDTEEGVLLKLAKAFPPAKLEELAGCLRYSQDARRNGIGHSSGRKSSQG